MREKMLTVTSRSLNAFVLTIFSGAGILIQIVNQLVLAFFFGSNEELEGYYVAMAIPMYIVTVISFCINASFVPPYLALRVKDKVCANQFANDILLLVLMGSGGICISGIIFHRDVIHLVFPGLTAGVDESAISLGGFLWPLVILIPLFTLIASKLQAESRFLLPSFAQVLNIAVATVIVGVGASPLGIVAFAVGTLAGAALQLALLAFSETLRLSHGFSMRTAEIRNWLAQFGILASGNIVTRLAPVMERAASALQPKGSIAELSYASRIVTACSSVVSAGISVIGFTELSELSAANDNDEFRRRVIRLLRATLLISAPISVILYFQIDILLRILFLRGEFTESNVRQVSSLVQCYLVFFVASNVGTIIGRGLYAIKMARIATVVDVVGILFYGIILFVLSRYFGILGVAWSYSAYFGMGVLLSGFFLFKKIGGVRSEWTFLGQVLLGVIAMLSLYALAPATDAVWSSLALSVLATVFYSGALITVKNIEMTRLFTLVKERLVG